MGQLTWKDDNPCSKEFDDIYFSQEGGLDETNYVFIEGNNLRKRWQNQNSDFTIIETGFGTGLNLFAAYRLWKSLKVPAKLNYVSIEKHPLEQGEIRKALSQYAELSEILDKFLQQYPSSNIELENCNIKIFFEDIKTALPKITRQADAWFLDGFAPAKNPQMWCDQLYETMCRQTKQGGTFSTFTSTGYVRRGLQDNQFIVTKQKGFGKKREMLVGEKS